MSLCPCACNHTGVSFIRRLILSDFRNYTALDITVEGSLVALAGENGAGKTNLLEALSLLSPGRGLRRSDYAAMARQSGSGRFAMSVTLQAQQGDVQIGVGYDPGDGAGRICRIDREPVPSPNAFASHCRILWLTPDNDALFRGAAGDRRKFLDRLVLAVDSEHGSRVNALDRALRSRNKILEDDRPDPQWLDAVEREVAEVAMAVTAARVETVQRLQTLILAERDDTSLFPFADIRLEGAIEARLETGSALEVEDWYRSELRSSRMRDRAAGRTLTGPNGSDLVVRHGPKDMPAELSSTGEQKALLIGLILAHAALVRQMSGIAPVLLLDEIAAHLDQHRRKALYARLATLGGQVWMTGTDASLFSDMPTHATLLDVCGGNVGPTV
jgi:DNA replication and repair protein RecF